MHVPIRKMSLDKHGSSWQAQIEELEVLQSIYGDAWKIDEMPYEIDITENGVTASLYITLPETYPQLSPPVYTLSAPSLSKSQKDEIYLILNNEYLDNVGCCVLYQWIERIREYLLNTNDLIDANKNVVSSSTLTEVTESAQNDATTPIVTHGEVFTDRKSSFQGHVARVHSAQQVKQVLQYLMSNKKIANATHNIYAYRISLGNSSFIQDCEDDGETQAGSRVLHLLQITNVCDVLVVVSRWYGGTHLGPDRFRLINNAARQVLTAANLVPSKKPL